MNKLAFKLEYEAVNTNSNGGIPVIIVAAGNSTRMGGKNKQFMCLCGIPTIVHTLLAFERCAAISNIIVVAKREDIKAIEELCLNYQISKLSDLVEGGDTRQQSVLNGLKAVKNAEHVLIHDGARPLVSCEIIERVCESLGKADGVICGVPIVDTLKRTDDKGFISKTIDRTNMISVQTPQAVKVKEYTELLNKCELSAFTDDASVLEMGGMSVAWVMGDKSNIKITTPDDIALAEFYLERKGKNECE